METAITGLMGLEGRWLGGPRAGWGVSVLLWVKVSAPRRVTSVEEVSVLASRELEASGGRNGVQELAQEESGANGSRMPVEELVSNRGRNGSLSREPLCLPCAARERANM